MIIWLASYPRSGNTFLRVILNSIFNIKSYSIYDDLKDIAANEKTSDAVGHELLPQGFDIEKARESKEVYFIKTHDKPLNNTDKAIYLVRDGRETMLSYTKYQNKYGSEHKELIDTIYGNTYFGSWKAHLNIWDPKNRPNTLTIKFEELTDNPYAFIDSIASFSGIAPVNAVIPTFNELQKNNDKFFSTGKKDSWKTKFSQKEHELFWLLNYEEMLHFNYKNNIPTIFTEDFIKKDLIFDLISEQLQYIDTLYEKQKQLLKDNQKFLRRIDGLSRRNEELTKALTIERAKNNV